jgi:Domain of unknown function (DUF397)
VGAEEHGWRKSSFSDNANCLEVDVTADLVLVRDTKDRRRSALEFGPDAWNSFLAGIESGDFVPGRTPREY